MHVDLRCRRTGLTEPSSLLFLAHWACYCFDQSLPSPKGELVFGSGSGSYPSSLPLCINNRGDHCVCYCHCARAFRFLITWTDLLPSPYPFVPFALSMYVCMCEFVCVSGWDVTGCLFRWSWFLIQLWPTFLSPFPSVFRCRCCLKQFVGVVVFSGQVTSASVFYHNSCDHFTRLNRLVMKTFSYTKGVISAS